MKFKRIATILCILLWLTTGASASVASLDTALAPLLDGRGAVELSAALTVKTWMPFDETRLELINRVLANASLNARIDHSADVDNTAFQLLLGNQMVLEMNEQNRDGAYLLQTSLLANRMLFSTQASPIDTLLAASGEEAAEPAEDTGLNTSDVEEAFDMLGAIGELEDCYRALIDKTVPLTQKNTPNYTIENIGKGRISYVARLTTEQSGELLPQLRAVLSCGMDAEYREELSQITFEPGFVVALYQNSDAEDICVYIKGNVAYPDGDVRTLKWQWAFTPDRNTQTFRLEAARESGTRDSRVIDAIVKRKEKDGSYSLKCDTTVNLRRSNVNETSVLTVDLQGKTGDSLTCKGSVTRVTSGAEGGESTGKTETDVTVDLALAQADTASELTGKAVYKASRGDSVLMELELAFLPAAASGAAAETPATAEAENTAPKVEISIIPADPAVAQLTAQTPTTTAEENQIEPSEFLVGAPLPLGLYDYEIPRETITINMDDSQRKVHQSLLNEAAQQLAGNLLLAILDLPEEDRQLLSDGMTEDDYAIFLAMLD